MDENRQLKLAQKVQKECIEAVRKGFQEASMSGLCTEGAMEAGISAIQNLELEKLIGNEE